MRGAEEIDGWILDWRMKNLLVNFAIQQVDAALDEAAKIRCSLCAYNNPEARELWPGLWHSRNGIFHRCRASEIRAMKVTP